MQTKQEMPTEGEKLRVNMIAGGPHEHCVDAVINFPRIAAIATLQGQTDRI